MPPRALPEATCLFLEAFLARASGSRPTDESEPRGSLHRTSPSPNLGLPPGGESSCIKILELERTSRGTKLGASDPCSKPSQSPIPPPRDPEKPGQQRAPPGPGSAGTRAALVGAAPGLSSSPSASCRFPQPSAEWARRPRGVWPSSPGRPGARSHERTGRSAGPTQSVGFAGEEPPPFSTVAYGGKQLVPGSVPRLHENWGAGQTPTLRFLGLQSQTFRSTWPPVTAMPGGR